MADDSVTREGVTTDYPKDDDEPFSALIHHEAEKSLKTYQRITFCFSVFIALLLAVVVAISVVLAGQSKTCVDFTDAEKVLINQVIHPPYKPNSWTSFSQAAVLPPPRLAHAATEVADEVAYMFGGTYGSPAFNIPYVSYGDLWRYSGATHTWTNVTFTGDIPPPRLHTSLVTKDDDTLLMFGGFNIFNFNTTLHRGLSDFYSFTISSGTWTRLDTTISGVAPSARGAHAASWMNGAMYVFGGFPAILVTGHLQELWKFFWANQSWVNVTMPAVAPEGRIGFSFVFLNPTTAIITAGGCSITVNPLGQCDTAWSYDVPSNTWAAIHETNEPTSRRATWADAAVAGIVYQFGGLWLNQTNLSAVQFRLFNDMYALDTSSFTWMPLYPNYGRGALPPPTFGHTASRLGRVVMIFGGRINSPAQPGTSQTWEYTSITPVS